MSDKEARALGAGDSIEVDGKEIRISPVGMQQLHEVQRAAVKYFKREYLTTFAENLDLLPEPDRQQIMLKKMEDVARWDVGNLPVRTSYDVSLVPVNNADLVALMTKEYGDLPESEMSRRAILATALDAGIIDCDDVLKLTGARPKKFRVPYDSWWVTAVKEGMVAFVLSSIKKHHPDITKDAIWGWPMHKIIQAARMAESLTAPALGNT